LDYDYNELDSNWLELDCIIEITFAVILRYINKTELNLNRINTAFHTLSYGIIVMWLTVYSILWLHR